jgi:hypothetical protein
MPDTRFPSSGNIRVWWVPANGFANWKAPTAAEIAAGIDVSDAISWNDKDFGVQASNQNSDPAITAKGNQQDRGAAQYGGTFSFYYPKDRTDTSNKYSIVYEALRVARTTGYFVVRVDGKELTTTSGTTANPGTLAATGDFVNVFRVQTGGYAESITGEEAFRYSISFLPKGQVQTRAIVRANSTPVAPVIVGTGGSGAAGTKVALEATLVSRKYTRGVIWKSTDSTKVTVSANGVFTRVATGTANITATDPATNTTSTTLAVTVA